MLECHCVKIFCIRSFSGPYFPAFGLNTDIYKINLHIGSECGKMRTRKTPNTDFFYAVCMYWQNTLKQNERRVRSKSIIN